MGEIEKKYKKTGLKPPGFGNFTQGIHVHDVDIFSLGTDEFGLIHFFQDPGDRFRGGADEIGQLGLGYGQADAGFIFLLFGQGDDIGGQPCRDFLEAEVLHLNGEFPQSPGEIGQHVHGQGRVGGDQFHKTIPGQKDDVGFFQGHGGGREMLTLKDRNFTKGVAGPVNMQNLLLALGGKFEHLYLSRGHHVQAVGPVAFVEDNLGFFKGCLLRNGLNFIQMFVGEPREQRYCF